MSNKLIHKIVLIVLALAWCGASIAKELPQNPIKINVASKEELMQLPGVGDKKADVIINTRNEKLILNDEDLKAVKGVGDKSAAKFSAEGLTVSGSAYKGASATEAKAKVTAEAKADKKADKPVAEKAKDAAVATKDAVKGAAVATKDAVKETAKDVKTAVTDKKDTKAKVEVKADAKADAAKPAASAAKK